MEKKCLLSLFLICFVFVGCTPSDTALPASNDISINESLNASLENNKPNSQLSSSSISAHYEISDLVGEYVFAEEDYFQQQENFPSIIIYEDGRFLYKINLLSFMGSISGKCSIEGNVLWLSILDRDYSGFESDQIDTIELLIVDEESLIILTDGFTYTGSENLYRRK